MQIKRVVTAVDDGKSVVAEELELQAVTSELMPGTEIFLLWGTEGPIPASSSSADAGDLVPFFPGAGGTRFGVFTFPPEQRDAPAPEAGDPEAAEAAAAEFERQIPGLLGVFEPDSPGVHQTATIDYNVVIQGTLTLELDDGKEVELPPRTVIVQRGARHAWHNYGDEPAALAYVIVAASA